MLMKTCLVGFVIQPMLIIYRNRRTRTPLSARHNAMVTFGSKHYVLRKGSLFGPVKGSKKKLLLIAKLSIPHRFLKP